jgi:hypothetical protein
VLAELRAEAPAAELVHPAQTLGGVRAHPVLVLEQVDAADRRLRGVDPRLRLFDLVASSSRTPSTRSSAGRLNPSTQTVQRIVVKTRKTMRSRPGRSSGMASAAASDTAPRMPVKATTVMFCHGGAGSRRAIPGKTRRGRYANGKTHRNRTTMTVRAIAIA